MELYGVILVTLRLEHNKVLEKLVEWPDAHQGGMLCRVGYSMHILTSHWICLETILNSISRVTRQEIAINGLGARKGLLMERGDFEEMARWKERWH